MRGPWPAPLPVWRDRELWSFAPVGHVSLAEAVIRIGEVRIEGWEGQELKNFAIERASVARRVSKAPPPIGAPRENVVFHAEALKFEEARLGQAQGALAQIHARIAGVEERLNKLFSLIQMLAVSGDLHILIDLPDGSLQPIDQNWWRTPAGEQALITGRAGVPPAWLFADAADLDKIAPLAVAAKVTVTIIANDELMRTAIEKANSDSPTRVARALVSQIEGSSSAADPKRVEAVRVLMATNGLDQGNLRRLKMGERRQ